ncbi:MAG: 4Fe-4S dicluster domain-containing protein, partial [Bacteroidales bacterium]|nr:4Fe-4S dicluster domain-containing protein [Bacteroidales bacterium]
MKLLEKLQKDIRFNEGLNACINCGVCTAICPAAQFSNYDPRMIVNTVQDGDESEIENLLKSDTIWYCGECLSCKTRCPRGNTPGYIIQALRALSIDTGMFIESSQGQKQLAIKRTVGDHILKYGYCVYIDEVNTDMYPEQGPVWDWLKKNRVDLLERLGTKYKKEESGALR